MTRNAIPIGAVLAALALAAPAGAAEAPADRPGTNGADPARDAGPAKPTHAERVNAAKRCRIERGTTPEEHAAFRDAYGTGPRKRNAFGRCVSGHARDVASERRARRRRAIRACRRELARLGPEAFRAKYGDGNGSPFRNCVREKLSGDDEQPPAGEPESEDKRADEPSQGKRRADPPATPPAERPDRR